MLLNKQDRAIALHQRSIALQDRLVAKEVLLEKLVPQNPKQATLFHRQFVQTGLRINQIHRALNAGKLRLTANEQQVNIRLNILAQLNLTNPRLAQQLANYLEQTFIRATFQSIEVAQIVNRPPATAFVPF
jgi:hypothetical protein